MIIAPDVSYFQRPVDDSFNREWLIFRLCDGDFIDPNAQHNLAWAIKARAAGKIKGFTGYVVYRPGKNSSVFNALSSLSFPKDAVVMIDGENWSGQIVGDHSTEINALAENLRTRQGGRADLVWAYGNRGPDLTVWPRKPSWIGWVVASYGGSKPDEPNLIGWQYTDGQPAYDRSDFPSSTPPFGRCDHNALYKLPLQEEDPLADLTEKQLDEISGAVAQRQIVAPSEQWPNGLTLAGAIRQILKLSDPTLVAKQVAKQLPAGSGVTEAQIEEALKTVLRDGVGA